MATKAEHNEEPMRDTPRREGDAQAEARRRPLLCLPLDNIVPPPLHLLQGLVNKTLEKMEKEPRRRLLERANVQASYRSAGLLTGGRCEKLLAYVELYPTSIANPHVRSVFRCI